MRNFHLFLVIDGFICHLPISMFLKASSVAVLLTITLSSVFGNIDLPLFIVSMANLKAAS